MFETFFRISGNLGFPLLFYSNIPLNNKPSACFYSRVLLEILCHIQGKSPSSLFAYGDNACPFYRPLAYTCNGILVNNIFGLIVADETIFRTRIDSILEVLLCRI
jgi:hypothetical protein